ncbi:small ribosomal subunit Rsm22 family protein [Streptomyces sp. V4-01]|uniref:Small ribosomal subunit Rsm22 family protein n=1 Tax=Actinacidiphila polyblastidii TaxID=3110430 RepID=A0ABU7PJE6_9ACTN|nr:small ribosomal subunit Rsm22 family protein [Streptomyces sp. V4-01]
MHLPDDLRDALTRQLHATAPGQASAQVERLIQSYRGAAPTAAPSAPILRDAADVAAYAAYRMPATYAAVRSALGALREQAADWAPRTHLDLGGGTGAATWAVADAWPDGGHTSSVLDWSQAALALGSELARDAAQQAVRDAEWTRAPLAGAPRLPARDLVTVSYVIGELAPADRASLIDAAAGAALGAVVVAEPGTPEGYARIIEARQRLIAAGLTVLAPCPHDGTCPVTGDDWCHFAARVPRTSLHRQVKGGTLPYEDEKFSYVAAVRPAAVPGAPAGNRIVRHPQIRKGQVLLDLCTRDDALTRTTVAKRHGAAYRLARDARWGETWPPDPAAGADAGQDGYSQP